MNSQELTQAIEQDLITLQSLKFQIIPAREYYYNLLKLIFGAICKLGIVIFLGVLYSQVVYYKPPLTTWHDYLSACGYALVLAVSINVVIMLFLHHTFSYYYLIKYHLQHRLKTGNLLVKKLKQVAYLMWGIFIFMSLCFTNYAAYEAIYIMVLIPLILSFMITFVIANMEMNRLGIAVLFTLANKVLNKL